MQPVSVEDVALTHGTARILTLARPDERNPLDHATVSRLRALTEEADADSVVRTVIITGEGHAFSAGGDLRAYIDMYEHEREFRAFLDEFRRADARLEHGRFVSIAMVNGPCVAGGLELALACDLITVADDARIGDGHLGTGQIDGAGGSQRLVARSARSERSNCSSPAGCGPAPKPPTPVSPCSARRRWSSASARSRSPASSPPTARSPRST